MTSLVSKPWGSYQVIEKGEKYVIKRIVVKSDQKLSLQSHKFRSEHWVVVQGSAEVTLDEKIKEIRVNENIFIPSNSKHRIANNTSEDLIIIEVWHGDILDEQDIIRYEDIYGRKVVT